MMSKKDSTTHHRITVRCHSDTHGPANPSDRGARHSHRILQRSSSSSLTSSLVACASQQQQQQQYGSRSERTTTRGRKQYCLHDDLRKNKPPKGHYSSERQNSASGLIYFNNMTSDNLRFDPWGRADQIIESIYTGRRSGHPSDDVVVDDDDDDNDDDNDDDDDSRKNDCCHSFLRTSRDTKSTADCSSTSSFTDDYPKHVHFPQGDHSEKLPSATRNTTKSKKKTTKIINLPWTDHRAVSAHYSGEVNLLIQPHGYGELIYADGKSIECLWNNGMPLRDDDDGDDDSASFARRRSKSAPGARMLNSNNNNEPSHNSRHNSAHCINELLPHDRSHKTTTNDDSPPFPLMPSVYDLGDIATSPQHMIIETDLTKAYCYVCSLKLHDFAFVRRSSGDWTYSIIANFPILHGNASIRFVMNNKGSTKTVEARHWGNFVRLVNWNNVSDHGYDYDCATTTLSDDEYENGDDDDTVPSQEEPNRRSEENTPMPSISVGDVLKLEAGVPKLLRQSTGQFSLYTC